MGRALIILTSPAERSKAVRWIHQAPSGTRVEFKATKRSPDQNSKMWACLTDVAIHVVWYGQKLSADDWKDIFTAATMAQDSRRRLDLEERSGKTKAEQKNRALEQKDTEINLAERKFQRDTCKLFLKWFGDQKAKEIVTGGGTNKEKIEALGRAMFGEDWDE